jgi:hypothetical protein
MFTICLIIIDFNYQKFEALQERFVTFELDWKAVLRDRVAQSLQDCFLVRQNGLNL